MQIKVQSDPKNDVSIIMELSKETDGNMKINVVPLDDLHPGEKGVVRNMNGHTAEEGYLMEMGLLVGTPVKLVKFAPLGDPLELRVRGYHLSIRRSEARSILVEKL